MIRGIREAAALHGLPLEDIAPADLGARFPFRLGDDIVGVFEQDAGFLHVERSVLAHLRMAENAGATLVTGDPVTGWRAEGDGVVVDTESTRYTAGKLVITAGAWAAGLLADLAIPLTVRRKHLHWYACGDPRYDADTGCPCFFYETAAGFFYGFPEIDGTGVKVAEHSRGVDHVDPLTDDRSPDPDDRARVAGFIHDHLPGVTDAPVRHDVCYYTMTPDEQFIVDRHPHHPNIAFAAGLSGHGYKFAPVLGEVLADLALDGVTRQPIGFLAVDRPGLGPSRPGG